LFVGPEYLRSITGVSNPNTSDLAATVTPVTTRMDAAAWEQAWTPRRPLATDDLALGCWRTSRDRALTRRYLEHSPKALQAMLVIDVDHPDALERAIGLPRHHPMPSWIAEGVNGRGHVGWVLREPVVRTDAGHRRPLIFAAKVEEGLRRALDGDVGYAGLLTKNPLHPDWYPHWGRAEPYDLGELAQGLGDLVPTKLPRRTESTGLGRNVTLFDDLRKWAYAARRRHTVKAEWDVAVLEKAAEHNAAIPVPLPPTEVRATAQSVGTWVWRRSFDEAGFRRVQTSRGRKGGRANTPEQQAAKRRRLDPAAALQFVQEQEVEQ